MTTESVVPEMLHIWAISVRASEEARRRGDRRTGTDHVLLALLEDPSIEVVLGVNLQQARQALESLDQEALGALGLGYGLDAPRTADARRAEEAEAYPFTPAQLAIVQDASSSHLIGTPDTVLEGLVALQQRTSADEIMISTRVHSYEPRVAPLPWSPKVGD